MPSWSGPLSKNVMPRQLVCCTFIPASRGDFFACAGRVVNRIALATRAPVDVDQLEAHGGQTRGLFSLHIPVGGLMQSPSVGWSIA